MTMSSSWRLPVTSMTFGDRSGVGEGVAAGAGVGVGVGVGWPDVLFCACTLLKATMSKPARKRAWTSRLALSVCMCVLTLLRGLINLKLLITCQDGTTCCGPRDCRKDTSWSESFYRM